MPRNGDGSSDNGPIEGHNIVHGASGDATIERANKTAPMPEQEKGFAVEGMNASGGGLAPNKQGEPVADSNKDQATKS